MSKLTLEHFNLNLGFQSNSQVQEILINNLHNPKKDSKNNIQNEISINFSRFQEIEYQEGDVLVFKFRNGEIRMDFPQSLVLELTNQMKKINGE